MKTKIVYVVTSDETDVYLEQALLSVFSLRKHNPNATVELVVDQITNLSIKGKRKEIVRYVDKVIVVEVPDKYTKGQKSRWLKTNLRNLVEDDFLYVDTDTIITDGLEDIDNFEGEIGAVRDEHATHRNKEIIIQWSKQDGWNYHDDLLYFNSGVMFVRDCAFTHEFYREWNEKWQIRCENYPRYIDQSPLAATNEAYKYPIREMDGIWNCQPVNGLSFLYKAKIMHYWGYNNTAWLFYDKRLFEKIKDLGYISEDVADLLDNAKGAFLTPNRVIAGQDLDIYYSSVFHVCKSSKKVFSLYNKLSKLLLLFCRRIR